MSSKKPSYIDSLFNIGFLFLLFWRFATLRGQQKMSERVAALFWLSKVQY